MGALAPASAEAVPAGFDLFETDPQQTVFSFRDETTIPAGFFAPSSQPFRGDVRFAGLPIEKFGGRDVGDADTVVRRLEGADLQGPFPRSSQPIPIEIVQLSLVSVAPIMVKTGQGTELWDVRATLSPMRRSQGQMGIRQDSEQGGTFGSQLQVFPRFTFRRLSDGRTTTLDTGAIPFPPQTAQRLTLVGDGVWRAGCVAPALALRGLNDVFCPGLTPGGRKQRTIEQAALAQHGVYPAQPRLEHFQCYRVRPRRRLKSRDVQLVDQLGAGKPRVRRHAELCIPVRKGRERFRNKRAHLQCYTLKRVPRTLAPVAVRNQFGPQRLTVQSAKRLCLPSRKDVIRRGRKPSLKRVSFTDHFQCYAVDRIRFRRRKVTTRGQFGRERLKVGRPVRLCVPVQKNGEPIEHPVQHLVCYKARAGKRSKRRRVLVRNQFGRQRLVTRSPTTLCLPSVKVLL